MIRNTSERQFAVKVESSGFERREHRRHDLEEQGIEVDRFDGSQRTGEPLGRLVDLSAGGIRIRTSLAKSVRPDSQIRLKLTLPDYAGISPFVNTIDGKPQPAREWVGWMTVSRVIPVDNSKADIAGRLVDMEELDRGMLGLYLSTQPLAA